MVRKHCVTELRLPQPLKQLGLQSEPNWGLDFVTHFKRYAKMPRQKTFKASVDYRRCCLKEEGRSEESNQWQLKWTRRICIRDDLGGGARIHKKSEGAKGVRKINPLQRHFRQPQDNFEHSGASGSNWYCEYHILSLLVIWEKNWDQ